MQLMKRFEPVFGEAVSTVSNKYTCISTVGCVPLQYTNIPGEQLSAILRVSFKSPNATYRYIVLQAITSLNLQEA